MKNLIKLKVILLVFTMIFTSSTYAGDKILPFIVKNDFYVDIDNKTSFEVAEKLIKNTNCIKP